jgi:hypothetical protein
MSVSLTSVHVQLLVLYIFSVVTFSNYGPSQAHFLCLFSCIAAYYDCRNGVCLITFFFFFWHHWSLNSALGLLGSSTTWASPPTIFVLVIFEIGSWSAWIAILLFKLPWVAGMSGACHSVQLLVEMGAHKLFSWTSLEQRSSWSSLPKWLGL